MAATLKKQIGDWGEAAARQFLENKGYLFLSSNWSCKSGEIDLIMKQGETRILVEVRVRKTATCFGAGAETVSWQKQLKLIRAAKFYQQAADYWGDLRFDVVSIAKDSQNRLIIEHIPHAFTA